MNQSGHVWKLNDRGEIDDLALESRYHNGPYCLACEEAFCEHCRPEIYTEACNSVIEGVVVVVRPSLAAAPPPGSAGDHEGEHHD